LEPQDSVLADALPVSGSDRIVTSPIKIEVNESQLELSGAWLNQQ
jgi:hypothetical protein